MSPVTACATSAPQPFVALKADRAVLHSLVAAQLADYRGEPSLSLRHWRQLESLLPAVSDLDRKLLTQAIAAGDMKSASQYALRLWNSGDYKLDARIILIAHGIRRADWVAVERFANTELNPQQTLEWERMFGPIVRGWAAVGRKDAGGIAQAMTATARFTHPMLQAHEAMMYLALRQKEQAKKIALVIRPVDRASQLAAVQLVSELRAAGLASSADALQSRIALLKAPLMDAALLLPTQRVSTAASGLGHWFTLMGDSFSRIGHDMNTPVMSLANAALMLNASDWNARLLLAKEYRASQRWDDGLNMLSSSRKAPELIWLRRAELLLEKGQVQAAIAEARKAIHPADTSRPLLVMHADFIRKTGDLIETDMAYLRLLHDLSTTGDDPNLEALTLISRAELHMAARPWHEISPWIEKAVSLAPDNPTVLNFAGYSAIERRMDLTNSLNKIVKASKKESNNPSILDSLGWAYYLTERYDDAVPLLEKAWRGETSNSIIAEHLGDAYWTVGRHFEARYMWRAALFLATDDMTSRLEPKIANGLTDATAAP